MQQAGGAGASLPNLLKMHIHSLNPRLSFGKIEVVSVNGRTHSVDPRGLGGDL